MLYSTPAEVGHYLGQDKASKNERFFARLPDTASGRRWWPTDVGVLASALTPGDPWTEHMLAHEVTHTLTWRWFYNTTHAPPLLLEGMATAVEGARSYYPLRVEVAAGNRSMPLLAAFANPNLWTGVRMARVTLAYLEGGALVKYVLARWGETDSEALLRRCRRRLALRRGRQADGPLRSGRLLGQLLLELEGLRDDAAVAGRPSGGHSPRVPSLALGPSLSMRRAGLRRRG